MSEVPYNQVSKGLVWFDMRAAYVILLVAILEESTLFRFFSFWVRAIEGDIVYTPEDKLQILCFFRSRKYSSHIIIPESYTQAIMEGPYG